MPGFSVAAQTRCLAGSLKKALHIAAELGCHGVQIEARHELRSADLSETGVRQLRKILSDLNLRVGSVVFPTRRGYANPVDLEPRLEATRQAMGLAALLQSRIFLCNLGIVPTAESVDLRSTLVEALTSLASHGNRIGVQLVAQTTVSDLAELVEFISSLPEGTLSLDLHPARLIARGRSPADFVAAAGRFIAHVHATDGVYDLGSGRGVEVELGRGSAEFPELIGMLEEHAYRGWLTIERTDSQETISEIANAVRYLYSM